MALSSSTQYGGVAQLGARLNGIEKVWGSNPHTSIRILYSKWYPQVSSPSRCRSKETSVRTRTSDACTASLRSSRPAIPRLPAILRLTSSRNIAPMQGPGKSVGQALLMALLLLLSVCWPRLPCIAQGTQPQDGSAQLTDLFNRVPDVTIFVIPTSGDTARVALAFSSRVPHSKVRQEIQNLRKNGWGIGDEVSLSDRSMGSGGRITTSGHFSLLNAPQIVDSAPALLPYLQAFQDLGHVSVVFQQSELKPYNGVDNFETSALVIRRTPGENAYIYEALIQDHKGKLPPIVAATPTRSEGSAKVDAQPGSAQSGIPLLPLMLILCAVGIIGGLCMYSWISRRASGPASSRKAR